jgi:hypothetical protein
MSSMPKRVQFAISDFGFEMGFCPISKFTLAHFHDNHRPVVERPDASNEIREARAYGFYDFVRRFLLTRSHRFGQAL